MKKTILMACCLLAAWGSYAQQVPEKGKPCPPFKLTHVTHYPKKQVQLDDFKGKWLFLDFWFTGCASCIESFPKISKLQQAFPDKVQFLLVGYNAKKTERNIEETFEKLSQKRGYKIASAYDSVLAKQWNINSMPHIVIVDPQGIVRYITSGVDMTEEKIGALLNGSKVTFDAKDDRDREKLAEFDGSVAGYPASKILKQSLLTVWNGEKMNGGYLPSQFGAFSLQTQQQEGFRYALTTLEWLYNTAYLGRPSAYLKFWGDSMYGKAYPFPVMEIKDKTPFENFYDSDFSKCKGYYNYRITLAGRKMSEQEIMQIMQQDLATAFGYEATVEEREMPVYKLVSLPGAAEKLRTKGGAPYYDAQEGKSIVAGFTVRNTPMKDYLMYVCYYLNYSQKHPFVDATGIDGNIDLTVNADLTDMANLKRGLREQGLDIVEGTKKMKVVVIRDRP